MSEKAKAKKKVAIVGYSTTRDMAPYDDPEFEIWAVNDLFKHIKRVDKVFQLHTPEEIDRTHKLKPEARTGWLHQKGEMAQLKCPVYMQDVEPDIPTSVKFPLEDIIKHFAVMFLTEDQARYFTNSISYMVAYAIYRDYKEIHVYGVDMATTEEGEYSQQRPSCEFWLGVAAGKGIILHIPKEADLLKTRFLYGYEEEAKNAWIACVEQSLKDIAAKKNQAIQQERTWQLHRHTYQGAEQAIKEVFMRRQ